MRSGASLQLRDLLSRPASAFVGEAERPWEHRLEVHKVQHDVAEALRGLLGRRLELVTLGAVGREFPFQPVFGCLLGIEGESVLALELDGPAARMLADWVGNDLAGLVGMGALGDVERALLECFVLRCLDRLQPPPSLHVKEFTEGCAREDGVWALEWRGELRGSGRVGTFGVRIARTLLAHLEAASTRDLVGAGTDAPFPIALGLPEIPLTEAEIRTLARGDVLLTGLHSLDDSTTGLTLVTPTGWRLAAARVLADSPTLVLVEAGDVDLRPAWRGGCHVRITIGATEAPLLRSGGEGAPRRIAIPKHTTLPACIGRGEQDLARGELVRIGEEIGVRVVQPVASQPD